MRSLRGLIICEDPELRTRVNALLDEGREVEPVLILQRYPDRLEAARQLNLCRPELVLLAIDRLPVALEFLKQLELSAPRVPVIGISRLQDRRALTELMRLGMRDCVAAPINKTKFQEAIGRIASECKEIIYRAPVDPLVCFLPSRGGSGTSTLACNISHVMSSMPDARVILADLDLACGLSRFLFQLPPTGSLGEFVSGGYSLNSQSWRQCVVASGELHVIHGGRLNPRQVFTTDQMSLLLESLSGRYNAVCIDLTGGMETYNLELFRRARQILLVSTTDTASIQLAREKLAFLATLDVVRRTKVLLTLSPGAATPNLPELQAQCGVPLHVFDFGEKRVRECLERAQLIEPGTVLGRQIAQFAEALKGELAGTSSKALN